jgi:hypothetical protein
VLVLPVETSRRDTGVRKPGKPDVVEDLVSGETVYGRLIDERLGNVLVALGVVIDHPGRERDWRVRKARQGLWT